MKECGWMFYFFITFQELQESECYLHTSFVGKVLW